MKRKMQYEDVTLAREIITRGGCLPHDLWSSESVIGKSWGWIETEPFVDGLLVPKTRVKGVFDERAYHIIFYLYHFYMPISISQTWNVIFVGDKDLWQCDRWASEGWSLELWEGGMSQSGQTFIQGAHITHPQSPFHSETISSHVLQHFTTNYGFSGFSLVIFLPIKMFPVKHDPCCLLGAAAFGLFSFVSRASNQKLVKFYEER